MKDERILDVFPDKYLIEVLKARGYRVYESYTEPILVVGWGEAAHIRGYNKDTQIVVINGGRLNVSSDPPFWITQLYCETYPEGDENGLASFMATSSPIQAYLNHCSINQSPPSRTGYNEFLASSEGHCNEG